MNRRSTFATLQRINGMRYGLEGGVRRQDRRVGSRRSPLDANAGAHLWPTSSTANLDDILDFQDKITGTSSDGSAEDGRARGRSRTAPGRKRPSAPIAYDLLQALPLKSTDEPGSAFADAFALQNAPSRSILDLRGMAYAARKLEKPMTHGLPPPGPD